MKHLLPSETDGQNLIQFGRDAYKVNILKKREQNSTWALKIMATRAGGLLWLGKLKIKISWNDWSEFKIFGRNGHLVTYKIAEMNLINYLSYLLHCCMLTW